MKQVEKVPQFFERSVPHDEKHSQEEREIDNTSEFETKKATETSPTLFGLGIIRLNHSSTRNYT